MARRRIAELPMSRLAIWARRMALFSLVATAIAVIIVRSGALEIVPALSTLAGALLLAVFAILLAFAAVIGIWFSGAGGLRHAIAAALIGFALIAYPLYLGAKAYRLPPIYDISTDAIDPPRFEALARLRPRDANPVTYAGLYTAELQHAAYADIEPLDSTKTPQEAFEVVMKIIAKRKWFVVDARPPQGGALAPPRVLSAGAQQPAVPPRDGIIEAVARTPLLGFRDDVVVRIRATDDGARIDVRSASRYGRHDFGSNAARGRALLSDIDNVLSAPVMEKQEKPDKKQPGKDLQAVGKGAARR